MKLVTFRGHHGDLARLGALTPGDREIVDVQRVWTRQHGAPLEALSSMQALIESGEEGLGAVRELVLDADAKDIIGYANAHEILAPLPQPAQIRDCLCFEEHVTGSAARAAAVMNLSQAEVEARLDLARQTMKQRPLWYKANRFSVSGHNSTVIWPTASQAWDYELEMAAVIGKRTRDAPPERVRDHIFGFTIFNDFSARDLQGPDVQTGFGPTISKDFDGGNGLGPCIVTADEFDENNARMIARVNGEVRCDNNSRTMTIKFGDLISYISRQETLHPGELICSGTVGGGCGIEFGKLLVSGDVVELEIVGIGVLRHTVLAAQ